MGFFDRVGDFFDGIGNAVKDDANGAASAIGAAWSAASNWKVEEDSWLAKPANPISAIMSPVEDASENIVTGAAEALNFAYRYGFARNASTLAQQATQVYNGNIRSITSADAWNEAYNRSSEISPGQAIVGSFAQASEILPEQLEIGPNWLRKSDDPFGPKNAKNREDFFRNTNWGKLSSGSIDALGVILADPGYLALKGANKLQKAKTTLDAADASNVLAKAAETGNRKATQGFDVGVAPSRTLEDGTALTRRQADQGQRVSQLIDRIIETPRRNIQAMPELNHGEDANSLAILMTRAKELHADDPVEMRKAIADVLGTAWGDAAAMGRLVARRDTLATDMERIVTPPPQNLWSWRSPTYQRDPTHDRAVAAQRKQIDDELGRLDDVIQNTGQRLGPVRIGSTAIERAAEASALRAVNESWLNTGFASAPIRMVTAMAGTRIPDHINIKDPSAGYGDMVNTLRLMRHTDAKTKQKLMDSFVRASTPAHRMNVVDATRNQIVLDAARKYGLTEKQAKLMIATGNGRMATVRNSLKTRLYSAAGDQRFVQESDPEYDVIHVFDKPFLKSMLEDAHPIIDPREVDEAIKIASRNRILDNAGAGGTMVADGFGTVKDVALDVLNMSTKLWKTAALARGAYPLRVMTDTQARQMAHMETQVFMATRYQSLKGLKRYMLTVKDGEGRSFRNIFKEGNLEESLTEMLTRDLGMGEVWNLTKDDVPGIVRNVMSRDGGMADLANEVSNTLLRKRRTGDFGMIDASSPEWVPAYLRAVNQQILNSPVAVQALKTPDVHDLLRIVRSTPSLRREAREVGAKYDRQEDWLRTVIAANTHLLPTPELRIRAMRKAAKGSGFNEREVLDLFKSKNPKVQPMPVHGEAFSVIEQGKTVASYNKVRNNFFKFVAEMPENVAGRSPLFWDSYRRQIKITLDRLDEDQITAVGVDVIRKNAMRAAKREVSQILFDASHSSNMAASMRLLSPFFSAWEDTMTKWGKLFYDNPQLFARVNQGTQGLTDGGWVQDQNGYRIDPEGRAFDITTGKRMDNRPGYKKGAEYILLPHRFAKYFGGGEGDIKIRKDSINSVFQGEPWWLPGFGPLVALPTNRMTREFFPKEVDHPILKYILPYGTTTDSEAYQLLPKWAKTASAAFGDGQAHQNQFKIFLAEAVIDERNGGPKVDLDKISNKTRNYFIRKAFVDFNSPVSITPTPKNQFYIDKAHEYRADKSRKNWADDFDRDFPGFGEMKLELSTNETGIVATDVAFDAQKKYAKDINADPENGWLYVGPANAPAAFNGAVHDWQVAHGFRTQKDPVQALKGLQAEQGWDKYNKFRTLVNLALEDRGLVSTQQAGAEDLQYALQEYRKILAGENSAWAEAQGSAGGGNKPQVMLSKAQEFMAKHPEARTRPDMVALQKYIDFRNTIKAALAQRDNKSLDYNQDLKYAFSVYTQQLVKDNYGFEQMYNRVLEYDNLSKDVT